MGIREKIRSTEKHPLYASKANDVDDENYYQRALRHAESFPDGVTTLEPGPAMNQWLRYLEVYAPKQRVTCLTFVKQHGKRTFPAPTPWDFDIRYEQPKDDFLDQ